MILADLFNELVLRRPSQRAIPNLDGPWLPNDRLETCARLAPDIAGPDGLAAGDDMLYVASGPRILGLSGPGFDQVREVAGFDAPVACLAWDRRIGLVAGVSGTGLVVLAPEGGTKILRETAGRPLHHPSGVAVDEAGGLLVTEGSARRAYEDWVWDLMEKGTSGRLLRFPPDGAPAAVLAEGLAFPIGVAQRPDDGMVLVAEAWRHRILGIPPSSPSRPQVVLDGLPGYPARIAAGADGGFALSFFALRTQLVEFVLREEAFRRRMMETIDPECWIAPSLSAVEHHLQPVQFGALRSQNIKKPWAPPRSYGLVVQLDAGLAPIASFHSRANGFNHGTSGLAWQGERLFVAARGADRILLPLEEQEGAA